MRLLVLGGGGREHALAQRLSQDAGVTDVFVYPGNPGMENTAKLIICGGEVSLHGIQSLVKEKKIDLVVIGPEKYLFEGYVDELRAVGISVYGPTKAAAFLEESKIKSKLFMREFGIPTSDFETANSLAEAESIIESHPKWAGYVLKLSGPALGKGVIVTTTQSEAIEAARQFFQHRPPGIDEGMVIEEKNSGREVSLFYACEGNQFRYLASACDHKRLKNNDEGPNTGGMGAYSPCHWIDEAFLKRIEAEVVMPTLNGMISQDTPFSGTLFLGLMVQDNEYTVLEYNTRFGDPETQTFLPILKGNFTELLLAASTGTLAELAPESVTSQNAFSLHVVKAAKGYPGLFGEKVESGKTISYSSQATHLEGASVFYAGVSKKDGLLMTSGGRVLGITGVGKSFDEAKSNAYQNLPVVHFEGEQFRTDIGGSA